MTDKQPLRWSDFRARLLTVAIGAPLILVCVYVGYPLFTLMGMAITIIAALELHNVLHDAQAELVVLLVTALACLLSAAAGIAVIPIVAALIALLTVMLRPRWAYPLLGGMYIGVPMGLLLLSRSLASGADWVAVLIINNWFTDGFALIGGRLAGKHKLAPHISPSKTIEGTLIGLLAGFVAGFGLSMLFSLPIASSLIANLLIAPLTVLGDLLESWIKRRFGVKNSGSLLPGHGGILDRIDGLLLAIIGLYLVLALRG